jgi:hypothetical protein
MVLRLLNENQAVTPEMMIGWDGGAGCATAMPMSNKSIVSHIQLLQNI